MTLQFQENWFYCTKIRISYPNLIFLRFDTHIDSCSCFYSIFPYFLELTGNDVIPPGKLILLLEKKIFLLALVFCLHWYPCWCILSVPFYIYAFLLFDRKWRHNSRKSEYFCWDFDSNQLYWSNEHLCQIWCF